MTVVDLWRRRFRREMEKTRSMSLACCVLNPYVAADMIYFAVEDSEPYPWFWIRRKWRVFRDAKQPSEVKT